MTYRPNPDSLAGLVLGFLARNPDEELTLDDIVAKFVHPGDSRNVHTQLMAALDHDMLTYDPEADVYRKGPVGLPSIRRPDDGDDGTGEKPGAAVKVAHRAPKVATRTPAPEVPKNQEQQAPDAINSAADAHFEHQGLAPAFDALITERIPRRRGERNGMDGNRAGDSQGSLSQIDQEADRSNPQQIGTVGKAYGAPARTEKAAHNVRDVDLMARAVAALEAMKPWTMVGSTDRIDQELGRRIFESPVTGKAWHDERSQRDTFWRPALRASGIRWRRAYQTRHTYATNALAAGANPAYIARQMGHKNAKMLFSVYAKWIDGADRGREKAKIEAMLSSAQPAARTGTGS